MAERDEVREAEAEEEDKAVATDSEEVREEDGRLKRFMMDWMALVKRVRYVSLLVSWRKAEDES